MLYFKGATPSVGDFVSVQRQSVVSYLMTAPSGALWVSDQQASPGNVWRVSTGGAVSLVTTAVPVPTGIVRGADSDMWVVNATTSTGSVFRITPQGVVTEFSLPQPQAPATYADPNEICYGSDGNLWVCGNYSNGTAIIWRVGADGTATAFPMGTAYFEDITSGPDGDLWLADLNGYLWQVATTGAKLNQFPVAHASGGSVFLYALAAGPDGNLWLADNAGGDWKVTPTGDATFYALPASYFPNPWDIASGPDSSLWVTDTSGYLWQVKTDGSATPFAVNGVGSGAYVAPGSDGNLWVAGTGLVAKVTPGGVVSYIDIAGLSSAGIAVGP